RLHLYCIGHVRKKWNAIIGSDHLIVIDFDIIRNITLSELNSFKNDSKLLRLFADFNNITDLEAVGLNVDATAIHIHVTMVDELACGKNSRNELCTIHDCIQTRFKKTDQVFTSIALATSCFVVGLAELLFRNIAVEAFQLLLCTKLDTEVRKLTLTALTVLAGTIFTTVNRGLRTTPDVFAKTAVNFILSGFALTHRISFKMLGVNDAEETRPPLPLIFQELTGRSARAATFIHGTRQMKRRRRTPAMAAFSHER